MAAASPDELGAAQRRLWVQTILNRCVRLAYWERLLPQNSALPEEMAVLLPPVTKFTTRLQFEATASEMQAQLETAAEDPMAEGAMTKLLMTQSACAQVLNRIIGAKQPVEVVQDALVRASEKCQSLDTDVEHQPLLLLTTLLYQGQQSLSHTFALLDRYQSVIKSLVHQFGASSVLHIITECWQFSPVWLEAIILHLVRDDVLRVDDGSDSPLSHSSEYAVIHYVLQQFEAHHQARLCLSLFELLAQHPHSPNACAESPIAVDILCNESLWSLLSMCIDMIGLRYQITSSAPPAPVDTPQLAQPSHISHVLGHVQQRFNQTISLVQSAPLHHDLMAERITQLVLKSVQIMSNAELSNGDAVSSVLAVI